MPWRTGRIAGSYNPDAEPSSGYTPLPAGEYQMEIVESDYVTNSKGAGNILKCKAQIVGGEHDLRPFYINYDLEHRARTKQDRGQREFAALRRATGVINPSDTSELHHKPFRARVDVIMVDGELRNSIAAILPEIEREPEFAADVAAWTPTDQFMFRLEGDLYQMTALAETVETLLVQVAGTLRRVNPPKAAALDYAATNLADLIGELSERYREVRFPGRDDELLAA